MTLREMQLAAWKNSVAHGFWDEQASGEVPVSAVIPEKLCLIHSEVSEALEDYRDGNMVTRISDVPGHNKPVGFPTELADIIIRVGDLAEALGINLEQEVELKMKYNATRPYKHGGKKI